MSTHLKSIERTPSAGSDSSPAPAWPSLPPQQAAVAGLAAKGLSDGEIAAALKLSEDTIGSYLKVIFKRLNVHSRTALMALLLAANPRPHESQGGGGGYPRTWVLPGNVHCVEIVAFSN